MKINYETKILLAALLFAWPVLASPIDASRWPHHYTKVGAENAVLEIAHYGNCAKAVPLNPPSDADIAFGATWRVRFCTVAEQEMFDSEVK